MLFLILGLLFAMPLGMHAEERISSFNSDITIHQNASMTVRETIDVVGKGISIQHGIVREFPTRYKDQRGNNYVVQFDIKNILLDGKPVPYHIRDAANGKMIYIGYERRYLPPGTYSFTIEYETGRQLGFFKEYDELYWNVTGNGWRLPIERASVAVHLLAGVPEDQIHVEGYTGYQGSKGQDYKASVENGVAQFVTTQPLRNEQGLTIVVTWPKGFVQPPTEWELWQWFWGDNKLLAASLIGLFGLLLLLLFSLVVWVRFRRSQDLGTVIPLFYPPENMSPGAMRYFVKRTYDAKVLAADLVNMAVRGFITIHYEPGMFWGGDYRLDKKKDPEGQFADIYQEIDHDLFDSRDSIELREKNRKQMNRAIDSLSDKYRKQVRAHFTIPAWYLSRVGFIDMFVWVAILLVGGSDAVFVFIGFVLGSALILGIFILLMRGYKPEGLEVKKEVEGFKLFLETAEKDRLDIIGTPPTKTPELYETYLPYAIALGVEKQWSRQFAPLFERMAQGGNPYTVVWISGGRFDRFNADTFASTISSSIASSLTPPGRSSGSGGGGSSGGGGGGGGGGGW